MIVMCHGRNGPILKSTERKRSHFYMKEKDMNFNYFPFLSQAKEKQTANFPNAATVHDQEPLIHYERLPSVTHDFKWTLLRTFQLLIHELTHIV